MLRTVVLVKEEDWQFHDLEVDHQVPEDYWVLRDKKLLSQDFVTFFRKRVDELFVKGARWQKVHRDAIPSIDEWCAVLRLDQEFRHELLGAVRALYNVIGLVLCKQAEQLFLPEWFFAMLTLLL